MKNLALVVLSLMNLVISNQTLSGQVVPSDPAAPAQKKKYEPRAVHPVTAESVQGGSGVAKGVLKETVEDPRKHQQQVRPAQTGDGDTGSANLNPPPPPGSYLAPPQHALQKTPVAKLKGSSRLPTNRSLTPDQKAKAKTAQQNHLGDTGVR